MVKLRYKIVSVLAVLLGVFLYGRCGRSGPTPIINPVLPPNDAAQITVNPGSHTITVVNQHGTNTNYLPNGPTVIDIGHDGAVSLKIKTFGLEREGFGGIGYVESTRLVGGIDLLYFHRFDLGVGASITLSPLTLVNTRAMATLSYTIASNTRATIAYDNHGQVGGFVTLRF